MYDDTDFVALVEWSVTGGFTVQVEKGLGVKILRVETIGFLPHLLELILAALHTVAQAHF